MNIATMDRPNVRRTKRDSHAIRPDRAEQALTYYRVAGLREPGAAVETVVSDFLIDLRHYCERRRQDFATLDHVAQRNDLKENNPR